MTTTAVQTQRNFLRENRQLVSQTPIATALRRLQRELEREQELEQKRKQCRYSLPTTASLARRAGTLPLLETHRRLLVEGERQVREAFDECGRHSRTPQSEKQIQTEDIWDEQFLNAALLKCCRRSEGDEPFDNDDDGSASGSAKCLRRTASNYELGRVSALQNKRRPLDSSLPAQLELERNIELGMEKEQQQPQQLVLQLAIPDITDVEKEPQLDHSLSARTNASSNEMLPMQTTADDADKDEEMQKQEEQHKVEQQQQVMLTEPQRLELLAAAQARQRQLIWEYNRLPLSMGTLRVRRLKVELEQQLDRIDSDLRMLSTPQAYIQHEQLHRISQISSISC